jgi:hypothetical protein
LERVGHFIRVAALKELVVEREAIGRTRDKKRKT